MPNSRIYFLIFLLQEYSAQLTRNFCTYFLMFLEHPARLTPNYWTSEKKVYTRIRYNLSPYCLTLETTSLCVWQIQSHWHQTIEANVAVGFLYNMKVCTEAKPLTLLPNFKIYFCRVVTRLDWCTSTKDLLSQCGWLSVNQLIFYHSVLQLHKVRLSGSPMYLYTMHNSWSYSYRTRQAETGLVQLMGILGKKQPRTVLNGEQLISTTSFLKKQGNAQAPTHSRLRSRPG